LYEEHKYDDYLQARPSAAHQESYKTMHIRKFNDAFSFPGHVADFKAHGRFLINPIICVTMDTSLGKVLLQLFYTNTPNSPKKFHLSVTLKSLMMEKGTYTANTTWYTL